MKGCCDALIDKKNATNVIKGLQYVVYDVVTGDCLFYKAMKV